MAETKIDYETQITKLRDLVEARNEESTILEKQLNSVSLEYEKMKLTHSHLSTTLTRTIKDAKYE